MALAESADIEIIVAPRDQNLDLGQLATAESADLIVLAETTDLDGAPCAAVVVPQGLADAVLSLGTIAIGYDGSRASEIALDRAIDLAERIGASLLILAAVEIEIGAAGYETRQPQGLEKARIERHLRHALERVPASVPVESRLSFGDPAQALLDVAAEVDLLVLGSRGSYTPSHRLALGNVATEVLRRAPCPTLVTPDS
jgi:nucleotide-binding universal stress UspA family protein